MIPADSENVKKDYNILLKELTKYNPELLDKKRVIAISKSDLISEKDQAKLLKKLPADLPKLCLSSMTNEGIDELKDILWKQLQ